MQVNFIDKTFMNARLEINIQQLFNHKLIIRLGIQQEQKIMHC